MECCSKAVAMTAQQKRKGREHGEERLEEENNRQNKEE